MNCKSDKVIGFINGFVWSLALFVCIVYYQEKSILEYRISKIERQSIEVENMMNLKSKDCENIRSLLFKEIAKQQIRNSTMRTTYDANDEK